MLERCKMVVPPAWQKKHQFFCQLINRFPLFSPNIADPRPYREQTGDEPAERHRRLFKQLHDNAGLSALSLPVSRLQWPFIVFVQEEQRLTAGHWMEHLYHRYQTLQLLSWYIQLHYLQYMIKTELQ